MWFSTIRFLALCRGNRDDANFRVSLQIYAIAKLLLQLIWYRAWIGLVNMSIWHAIYSFTSFRCALTFWSCKQVSDPLHRTTTSGMNFNFNLSFWQHEVCVKIAKHHVHLRHNGTTSVYIYKQFIFRLCFSTLWLLVYANLFRWSASRQRCLGHLQLNQLSSRHFFSLTQSH